MYIYNFRAKNHFVYITHNFSSLSLLIRGIQTFVYASTTAKNFEPVCAISTNKVYQKHLSLSIFIMVENVGAAPLFGVPGAACFCYTTFSLWWRQTALPRPHPACRAGILLNELCPHKICLSHTSANVELSWTLHRAQGHLIAQKSSVLAVKLIRSTKLAISV